jgi:hypothetical protein
MFSFFLVVIETCIFFDGFTFLVASSFKSFQVRGVAEMVELSALQAQSPAFKTSPTAPLTPKKRKKNKGKKKVSMFFWCHKLSACVACCILLVGLLPLPLNH